MSNGSTITRLNELRRPQPTDSATETNEGGATRAETQGGLTTSLLWLFACTKDGIDWVFDLILIGEIPFIGQVPGAIMTVSFIMYLSQKGLLRGGKLKSAAVLLLLGADNLPIVNNVPFASAAVLLLRLVRR